MESKLWKISNEAGAFIFELQPLSFSLVKFNEEGNRSEARPHKFASVPSLTLISLHLQASVAHPSLLPSLKALCTDENTWPFVALPLFFQFVVVICLVRCFSDPSASAYAQRYDAFFFSLNKPFGRWCWLDSDQQVIISIRVRARVIISLRFGSLMFLPWPIIKS